MGAINASKGLYHSKFTFKLKNFISHFSLISWKKYFGPRYFDIALQTEIIMAEAVHTAIPKVLAAMPKDPVSFK